MKNCRCLVYTVPEQSVDIGDSMIISASRRTDIPAFYSRWFVHRLMAGWCLVPNPINTKSLLRVPLRPEDIDAIVFWSKNPLPLLGYLDRIDDMGFRYYFQFTLNDYPSALEPGMPPIQKRLSTFHRLSQRLGPLRVVWRYDPIIISSTTPHSFHVERFSYLAKELNGATRRVVVSFVCLYQKTLRRLCTLENNSAFRFSRDTASKENLSLLKELAAVAAENGIQMFTCAATPAIQAAGIPQGKCIDDGLVRELWGLDIQYRKDPSQRQHCLCTVSKDIGVMDTCLHGCIYCYSTRDVKLAKRRYQQHQPDSPALWLPRTTTSAEVVQQGVLPV